MSGLHQLRKTFRKNKIVQAVVLIGNFKDFLCGKRRIDPGQNKQDQHLDIHFIVQISSRFHCHKDLSFICYYMNYTG